MNRICYETREAVYRTAIEKYGRDAQVLMAIEEMSELTKELCKEFRGKLTLKDLADEVADVSIMLEQIRLMFDLNDLVCERMDVKIERLAARISFNRPEAKNDEV